uniref:LPS-induced TNF-alpha factor n=1 Tax=Pinctada fucata TaxID=50426 RepID=C8YR42_PINFU|nr:LPS-induced TNF-alpha factor [Pinctada fucata]
MSKAPPPPTYSAAPAYGTTSAYPPPPPGYGTGPGYSVTNTNVVVAQPGIATVMVFRELPVQCTCPSCGASVVTSTSYETGTLAWVICLVLALFGLWLGCCLIPFCINGCKDVIHSCPNCRHTIGKFNRM